MKKKIIILCCLLTVLSACQQKQIKKAKKVEAKETTYVLDETTSVLLDSEISKDKIVRYYRHGDHWHVFTKDGKEHITYSDPSKLEDNQEMELVSVITLAKLKQLKVKEILKHGDHYHIYTEDNHEYLTYENPSSLFPNLVIGNYDEKKDSNKGIGTVNNLSLDENKIVKVLRHGDHWHLYNAKGEEFITRNDPSGKYPDAYYGEYQGSHSKEDNKKETPTNNNHKKPSTKDENNKQEDLVRVIDNEEELKKLVVIKILKHGDHYHIYTEDKKEIVTHLNPRSYWPDIIIGEYEEPDKNNDNNTEDDKPIQQDPNDPKRIVKIAKHGNHWHLFRANGEEEITYHDPSKKYPDVEIIDYDKIEEEANKKELEQGELFTYEEIEAKKIVPSELINYGGVLYATKFKSDTQEFVSPHLDHFHYISIKTIIQLAKDKVFGEYSARDVVATIKWYILNPDQRPKKKGWGELADEAEHKEEGKEEEIVKKWAKIYNLSEDEFYDYLFNLEVSVPLTEITFNEDKTVIIKNERYDFISGKKL